MTIKSKISILTFIMFLSLISIGFASWTIATPEQNKTSDNSPITAEDTIDSFEHLEIVESTNFTYFANGFTTADGTITDSGTMTVKLKFISTNLSKFTLELKFDSAIDADFKKFDSITYSISNSTYEEKTVSGEGTIVIDIERSKITPDAENCFTLTFVFNENHDTFKSDIYSVLEVLNTNKEQNIFAVSLTVTELTPEE